MDFKRAQLLPGERPFSFRGFCHVLGIRSKQQSISCVLPNVPQVERGSLFSCAYFATDICNAQPLDFIGLKNRRKTYPLRNKFSIFLSNKRLLCYLENSYLRQTWIYLIPQTMAGKAFSDSLGKDKIHWLHRNAPHYQKVRELKVP